MYGLYDDAELYNLVAPPDKAMEQFYVDAAGGPARRVLELACGSGRFTLPLAKSGADVTAADLSRTMLAKARSVAREDNVSVEFVELDMRDFELGRQFDAIVITASSLLHLHSGDDFARAFAAMRRHLAPGGALVFDIFVPNAYVLSRTRHERQLVGVFSHPALGKVTVEETIEYDPIAQISQADWYWSTHEDKEFRRTTLRLRQIYPQELPLLLAHNGFELLSRFGGFHREPLSAQSWRQVCIAGKSA